MKLIYLLIAFILMSQSTLSGEPTVQQLLSQVGLKSEGDQRGQMDTIGFALRAEQMDQILTQCQKFAQLKQKELADLYGYNDQTAFIAGICPHDDFYYASRLYQLLIPHIKASRIIIFGVFHKARYFNCKNVLVFDSYKTWHGPYGPVQVSDLRGEIIRHLPTADYVVNNDMQMVEHSVEAIISFLQSNNRNVEIVSILVPYMDWNILDNLACDLSQALTSIIKEKKWKLGQDLALICSMDAVHYGDEGWGGSNYAVFGSDAHGYQMAVKQDLELANKHLCGELKREKLQELSACLIEDNDVTKYKITWCGRFSVPFGLNVASRIMETIEGRNLKGYLLDYGTSISETSLETEGLGGLGPTAPNNFHHWVGYVCIGYK